MRIWRAMRSTRSTQPTRPQPPTWGRGHKATSMNWQMRRQIELEVERNRLGNTGVLKATSGNAKRLKMRQETRVTTRAGKLAKAAVKHMASQELQMEKARMEEWKRTVMLEVAHELQGNRKAQEEAMEVQRQGFQFELERVRGELELFALRATALEKEIEFTSTQKPA